MKQLTLDLPMIDWLTMTTWDIKEWSDLIDDEHYIAKTIDGYKGLANTLNTFWVGTGEQKNHNLGMRVAHRMLQSSGAFSDASFDAVAGMPYDEAPKCTRIDIQMTVEWQNPDLFGVLRRWREKGRKGTFLESKSGATCYLGAWASERFLRVYQKSEEQGLTRLEVCYHKAYADPIYWQLQGKDETEKRRLMAMWMRYELLRTKDPILDSVFGKLLTEAGQKPPRTIRRPTNQTEKWFLKVVCPALFKYVHSDDISLDIIEHIRKITDEAL